MFRGLRINCPWYAAGPAQADHVPATFLDRNFGARDQHGSLAQLRAVEHRRYLVRASNSGLSAIVDAAGRVVMRGGQYREEALIGEARYLRRRTVYEQIGDAPYCACALAIALMALVEKRRIFRAKASP